MNADHLENRPVRRPGVVLWFKIYAGFLCFMYVVLMAAVVYQPLAAWIDDDEDIGWTSTIPLQFFFVLGIALFVVCFIPLVLRPRPWLWTHSLVVICLGMTSACFLPICIPLLIFWLKPETKAFYNRR